MRRRAGPRRPHGRQRHRAGVCFRSRFRRRSRWSVRRGSESAEGRTLAVLTAKTKCSCRMRPRRLLRRLSRSRVRSGAGLPGRSGLEKCRRIAGLKTQATITARRCGRCSSRAIVGLRAARYPGYSHVGAAGRHVVEVSDASTWPSGAARGVRIWSIRCVSTRLSARGGATPETCGSTARNTWRSANWPPESAEPGTAVECVEADIRSRRLLQAVYDVSRPLHVGLGQPYMSCARHHPRFYSYLREGRARRPSPSRAREQAVTAPLAWWQALTLYAALSKPGAPARMPRQRAPADKLRVRPRGFTAGNSSRCVHHEGERHAAFIGAPRRAVLTGLSPSRARGGRPNGRVGDIPARVRERMPITSVRPARPNRKVRR